MILMNSTVEFMILQDNKSKVHINKFNFMGFLTKFGPGRQFPIKELRYIGEYQNNFIRASDYGFFPSFFKLKRYFAKDKTPEGDFAKFYEFMGSNKRFLISKDMVDREKAIYHEGVLQDIISGK